MTADHFDTITLRGKEIPVTIRFVRLCDLHFYPENPRIYSIICDGGGEPTQDEIFEKLKKMEHVRDLVHSIKENEGLREPIIVRDGMVLEGNSRLAAYLILAEKDNVTWGKIKCKILPPDVGDDIAFAILADHISGKKDWAPYEQAGYLYRRHELHKVAIRQIAGDMGLSVKKVNFLIEVYRFMIVINERNIDRWSYYYEYLKSNKIKKIRQSRPELDQLIIDYINNGDIPTAMDLRDKLPVILTAKTKTVNRFLHRETTFDESYDAACAQGLDKGVFRKLFSFRMWLAGDNVIEELHGLDKTQLDKCTFELDKISRRVNMLLAKLNNSK